ncbi:hypothetical protein, partial [Rhodopirellula islandica]|uniref:hypothetical protein n=1 Tax=Rhodopirellula islandica TaxID=595434 RepID=UPI001F3277AD
MPDETVEDNGSTLMRRVSLIHHPPLPKRSRSCSFLVLYRWLASGFRPGRGRRGSWGRPSLTLFEVALLQSVLLANGQHQPTRFELNLAVGQNGAVLYCSRGDAPGYVEKGRWPLTDKTQLQSSRFGLWLVVLADTDGQECLFIPHISKHQRLVSDQSGLVFRQSGQG